MNIESAKRAGEIAAALEARNEKVAAIQAALDAGWQIKEARAVEVTTGREISAIVSLLDVPTSAQVLGFALQIYAAQIAALQAELDAL
jgi:hypothetical protein